VVGEIDVPSSSRVDGPVPKIIGHDSDLAEAEWVANRAKLSRAPGRRWSSIAVLARTNAHLATLQAVMEAAHVPSRIAGSDLGPASDVRRGYTSFRVPSGEGEEPESPQDAVVLTTFHRSKGLQWPSVIIVGLSTGLMPLATAQTQEAIDEERRLFYVALTRAEEELWCSWSSGTDGAGPARQRSRSPWLEPLERAMAQLEREAAPTAASDVSARVAELRGLLEASGDSGTR
jgi:superfamily I DNA/RNA helicase